MSNNVLGLQHNYLTISKVGRIKLTFRILVQDGWLKCNGDIIAIADYQALYDVIGQKYKLETDTYDENTYFRLPNIEVPSMTGLIGDLTAIIKY